MILTDEKQVVAKQWNIDSNKILIAMGGSDPYNITLKALKAISGLKTRLEIHLLLGPGYRFLGSLEDVRRNIYQPLHFHHGIPQEGLPSFLAGFKLAIMSFGLTVYSAARAGLPVICLAHHPQGAEAARTFFKDQATGKFIGEQSQVPGESIARETIKLLENNNALRRFSQNGQETVDGKGLERVVNIIMSRIS